MWIYILICLSLSLAGISGLQFFYMMYLEQIGKDKQKRIRELEIHSKNLTVRLQKAELQIAEQNDLLDSVYEQLDEESEEVWADVIEEG
jgi:hypothetical protein